MAKQGTAQFGSNVVVGEDTNGNPFLEEKANGNRATLKSDGTFDTSSIGTEQVVSSDDNGVLIADSPDEMDSLLNDLPSHGGTVRLRPGSYGDSDWTKTITIPDTDPSHYCLDFTGCEITISTFAGPYIQKPATSTGSNNPVTIYGPRGFDVSNVSSPGIVLDLYDIELSTVYWPHCFGSVDAIYSERMTSGSGHMNKVLVKGYGMKKGIVIGNPNDSQTTDRSMYWGQLGGIEQVGVHIKYGQTNHIYVQPERDKSGYSATGIKDDYGNNIIQNIHGQTSVPLDIQGNYTQLRLPGASTQHDASKIGTPPRNIYDSLARKHLEYWKTNTLSQYSTGGTSAPSYLTNFAQVRLSPGTTSGNDSFLETPSGLGDPANGAGVYTTISPGNTDSYRHDRFGAFLDANNYILLRADAGADGDNTTPGNWIAEVVEGGTVQFSQDTGVTMSTNTQDLQIWYSPNKQTFYHNMNEVASSTYSFSSGFNVWKMRERIDLTTVGSPSSSPRTDVTAFENVQMEERRNWTP